MVSRGEKITLVMDNFKTHSASAFYETFEPAYSKLMPLLSVGRV
jgi:hypothetical protein